MVLLVLATLIPLSASAADSFEKYDKKDEVQVYQALETKNQVREVIEKAKATNDEELFKQAMDYVRAMELKEYPKVEEEIELLQGVAKDKGWDESIKTYSYHRGKWTRAGMKNWYWVLLIIFLLGSGGFGAFKGGKGYLRSRKRRRDLPGLIADEGLLIQKLLAEYKELVDNIRDYFTETSIRNDFDHDYQQLVGKTQLADTDPNHLSWPKFTNEFRKLAVNKILEQMEAVGKPKGAPVRTAFDTIINNFKNILDRLDKVQAKPGVSTKDQVDAIVQDLKDYADDNLKYDHPGRDELKNNIDEYLKEGKIEKAKKNLLKEFTDTLEDQYKEGKVAELAKKAHVYDKDKVYAKGVAKKWINQMKLLEDILEALKFKDSKISQNLMSKEKYFNKIQNISARAPGGAIPT